jgi:hypothetical protein
LAASGELDEVWTQRNDRPMGSWKNARDIANAGSIFARNNRIA